jgi:protoheme IX farnesyltransferase
MAFYVAALVPVSLLLYWFTEVGLPYVIMALILGSAWLISSIRGFFAKDDILWARKYFVFSLIYLTIMFVGMMVVTI